MEKILVVEDDRSMRETLDIMLRREGYKVACAASVQEAQELLKRDDFAVVMTDLRLGKALEGGLDIVSAAKKRNPSTEVIVLTAFASTESAVAAMKQGALDYIIKSPNIAAEVKLTVRNAVAKFVLATENIRLWQEVKGKYSFGNIVGNSPRMQQIYALIKRVAQTKANVLVCGESGTGKELVAKAIHFNSPRRQGPFVTVSCGAIPENLMESELFGHVKGSFSGAIANKEGLFEHADVGTAFLDEIGELPLSVQVTLLRLIQEKTFKKVGGVDDIEVDVRIIAATNRDLETEVRNGRFREDLYYRLNVIRIDIPPLRERRDDIDLLVKHFMGKYTTEIKNASVAGITNDAMNALRVYDFPGNVRELENLIERAVTLETSDRISLESLPPLLSRGKTDTQPCSEFWIPPTGLDIQKVMGEHEAIYLRRALESVGGDKAKAARMLGLTMRQMRYKLKKLRVS